MPVEDVVRHGVAEGQGRDGEIEALDAQRRQADDHRRDDSGEDADAQGGEEVDVVVGDEAPGDARGHTHEAELTEADLPGPPCQHDQGHRHDPEQGEQDQVRGVVHAQDVGQRHHQAGTEDDRAPPGGGDLGELAQLGGDGAVLLDRLPPALAGIQGACPCGGAG